MIWLRVVDVWNGAGGREVRGRLRGRRARDLNRGEREELRVGNELLQHVVDEVVGPGRLRGRDRHRDPRAGVEHRRTVVLVGHRLPHGDLLGEQVLAVSLVGEDRRRPGVLPVLVGDPEVEVGVAADRREGPDLGLAGSDRERRVVLAVHVLRPGGADRVRRLARAIRCGSGILEIALALRAQVRRLQRDAATIRQDDAHRQPEHPLLVLAPVLGPRIERVADLQDACQAPVDLIGHVAVFVRVVPVQPAPVGVGDLDLRIKRGIGGERAVDVVAVGERTGGQAMRVEVDLRRKGRQLEVELADLQLAGRRQVEGVPWVDPEGRRGKLGGVRLAVRRELKGGREIEREMGRCGGRKPR